MARIVGIGRASARAGRSVMALVGAGAVEAASPSARSGCEADAHVARKHAAHCRLQEPGAHLREHPERSDRRGRDAALRAVPQAGVHEDRCHRAGRVRVHIPPTIRTDVYATWKGTTSHASPTIAVRPLVVFRTLNAAQNRYLVRVQAARSYGRNLVRIQRQNQRGVWVTTLRVQLNARGQKRFTGKFPHGVTKAQATVPKHPGYIAGFSTIKTIVR